MHRYFFHLSSNRQCLDDIGAEPEDLQAAKCLAVRYMVEHLCNQPHIF